MGYLKIAQFVISEIVFLSERERRRVLMLPAQEIQNTYLYLSSHVFVYLCICKM